MNYTLQRLVFPLATLGWAGVMLYFYGSGRIRHYLAPDFQPICLVGGLVLAVLSLFVMITYRVSADCGHNHRAGDVADHEAAEMHPLASLVLMLAPVMAAVMWTQDMYSQEALARKALYDAPAPIPPFSYKDMPPLTMEEIEKTHRKNADGDLQFNLLEIYFAMGDVEMIRLIEGKGIEIEGRLVMEKMNNPNGTRRRLYRLFITCCAADARALPIILEFGKTPPEIAENQWVKVTGVIRFPKENGATQAVLEVKDAKQTDAPWEESFMRNY